MIHLTYVISEPCYLVDSAQKSIAKLIRFLNLLALKQSILMLVLNINYKTNPAMKFVSYSKTSFKNNTILFK